MQSLVSGYPSEHLHERIADGVVHVLGLIATLIAGTTLMVSASLWSTVGLIVACAIYCAGLLSSFVISASYHLLPRHDWRQFLRRLDHVAIYALIAGTFTPLLVHIATIPVSVALYPKSMVWLVTLVVSSANDNFFSFSKSTTLSTRAM